MTMVPLLEGQLSFDDLLGRGPTKPGDPAGDTDTAKAPAGAATDTEGLTVEVVRSTRRRKTAQARMVGTTLEVRIPNHCSASEEQELVDHFRARFERSRHAERIDLDERARTLAGRYQLSTPTSIRWVDNQQHRWGSCTPADGSIRLSTRLARFPDWVIDYVIVHELAHLSIADHSPAFWRLVEAYPLCERARGYLLAKGGEDESPGDT